MAPNPVRIFNFLILLSSKRILLGSMDRSSCSEGEWRVEIIEDNSLRIGISKYRDPEMNERSAMTPEVTSNANSLLQT